MQKRYFLAPAVALLLAATPHFAQAQTGSVGIGTTTPAASAALEIRSTSQGLLLPRLSLAQRQALTASTTAPPVPGLVIYQTDNTPGLYAYDGTAWVRLGADNLGNHTATQNLNLQANALVGTGDDLGSTVGVGVRADGGLNLGQTSGNIYLGYQAGAANTGSGNVFSGYQSGYSNTTGIGNVFSGQLSGYRNTEGNYNMFSGFRSGFFNTTGNYNTFSGFRSGQNNVTGSGNVFIGFNSGQYNGDGGNNTALGNDSGPTGYPTPALTNTTALGARATVSTSNTIQLGDYNITSLRCQVGLTVTSDARFKYDVQANVPGLAFIERLRPVTYRFDQARLTAFAQTGTLPAPGAPDAGAEVHTGFLAQDVAAAARALGYRFDGVHAPANARDHYGLSYAQFVVPLVRAVQEQQAQIATLQQQNAALQQQNAALKAETTATTDAFEARLRRLEAATGGQAQR